MEKTVLFGNSQNLVGILSVPVNKSPQSPVGIIILNAGFIHHIGPYRMSVDLARGLENLGFPVLRFDFSGIGDSGKASVLRIDNIRIKEEFEAAAEVLSRHCNCKQYIIIGLCSGADNAHILIRDDARIIGIVPIDGYAYPTMKFYLKDYGPAVLNPKKWVKHSIKILKKITTMKKSTQKNAEAIILEQEIYERKFPLKEQVVSVLERRLSSGMKAFYIYSAGVPIYYNYENQFWDMFKTIKNKKNLDCKYYQGSDHSFTDCTIRAQLIRDILEWCKQFSE